MLHEKNTVRVEPRRRRVCVERPFGGHAEVPHSRARARASACPPGGRRRADARRQLAPEPGDVLPDLGRAGVRELMAFTLDKNMIDKDEYPQTAEIEARCVHMLADLWNSPDAANTIGTSTTGSSEAAMLGGMALKWKWRERRRAAGKPTDKPNLVTGPVQICWHKFARYFDVEMREIPMEGDRLIMTPEEVVKRVDENTIGVVPTLGVTFTCQYEPVEAIGKALDKLRRRPGSTSRFTSTAQAAASSRRSSIPSSCGTFGCRG